jgi:hypothetical protein
MQACDADESICLHVDKPLREKKKYMGSDKGKKRVVTKVATRKEETKLLSPNKTWIPILK